MRAHPRHHLAPYYRQQIYTVLKRFNRGDEVKPPRTPNPKNVGDRTRGWLAVQTAEHVMPVFEQGPFDLDEPSKDVLELPYLFLELARGIMEGRITIEVANQRRPLTQDFAVMLGFARNEPETFPVNATLAALAIESAFEDVLGWYEFDMEDEDHQRRRLRPPSKKAEDEELVWTGGDTAGTAGVAYSCGRLSTRCEPGRLDEFWTWWLTEALPSAWEMAVKDATAQK